MKVFLLPPGENWIVDRMVAEWTRDNHDITTSDPNIADVIFLTADWCWRRVPYDILKSKKVVTMVHHIVPEKLGYNEQVDFALRDDITDVYVVPNDYTKTFIKKFTKKPIEVISYWANQNLWFKSEENKYQLRAKHGLPIDAYLIGSFQRDTEGASCDGPNPQPKWEKGPDLLADAIISFSKKLKTTSPNPLIDPGSSELDKEVHVVLAGWRRQYLIKRFNDTGVPFTYIENPPFGTLRELYQTLDLYPVTARYEGGPQSLIECGLLDVPVVSRPIGIAPYVLPFSAIHEDVTQATPAVPNVGHLTLPEGYRKYRELFERLANG